MSHQLNCLNYAVFNTEMTRHLTNSCQASQTSHLRPAPHLLSHFIQIDLLGVVQLAQLNYLIRTAQSLNYKIIALSPI